MNTGDALALLRKKLPLAAHEVEAVQLIHVLESMPLALAQAAAFIQQREPRMTISRYLLEFHTSDHNRARLLGNDSGDSRRDAQASNSVIATWQISFEHIRKQRPSAARLLSLMSLFDRQGISEKLLCNRYAGEKDEAGEDGAESEDHIKSNFDDDIHTLTRFSLVKMSVDGRDFKMHRLVQFSTKKWLEQHDELELWKEKYAMLMDDSYPVMSHEYKYWAECQALFPHVEAAATSPPKDGPALVAWASVLFKAASYGRVAGLHSRAQKMCSAALQVQQKTLGAEHLDTLITLSALGDILLLLGNYVEAEAVHQQVLNGVEQLLGSDHRHTLTTLAKLATIKCFQGRLDQAEELEMQVLQMRKTKLGHEHPDTLASMAKLALTYRHQGRPEKAEELDVQVLQASMTKLGRDHGLTLVSMNNLAITRKGQGRDAEAIGLMREVVRSTLLLMGVDHSYHVHASRTLACWEAEQVNTTRSTEASPDDAIS